MNRFSIIAIAFILDLLIGDPYSWPHPVKVMGNYISVYTKKFRDEKQSAQNQYIAGIFLAVSLVIFTIAFIGLHSYLFSRIHPLLRDIWWIYLTFTSFSVKSLTFESKKVFNALSVGTIEDARKQVGMIVGRRTETLTHQEIAAATVETVAENTSDGFIAPLFYTCLFGVYGGMIYKAINTLDSMVGYINGPNKYFGRFSAKVDDVFNYLPARLTWLLMLVASLFPEFDFQGALKIGIRDCKAHSSPNAGFPESVTAGAFGIQLGGTHKYGEVEVYKPTIGDPVKSIDAKDILSANRLLIITAFIAVGISGVLLSVLG